MCGLPPKFPTTAGELTQSDRIQSVAIGAIRAIHTRVAANLGITGTTRGLGSANSRVLFRRRRQTRLCSALLFVMPQVSSLLKGKPR